jgi:hypothetical protein
LSNLFLQSKKTKNVLFLVRIKSSPGKNTQCDPLDEFLRIGSALAPSKLSPTDIAQAIGKQQQKLLLQSIDFLFRVNF